MFKFLEFSLVAVIVIVGIFFAVKLKAEKNESKVDKINKVKIHAWLDKDNLIKVNFSEPVEISEAASDLIIVDAGEKSIKIKSINPEENKSEVAAEYLVETEILLDVNKVYMLKYGENETQIIPRNVLNEERYFYNGNDLGCTYSQKESHFKLWAPTVQDVTVLVYDNFANDNKFFTDKVSLIRTDCGVWQGKIEKDLNGRYYLYKIELYNNGKLITNYVVDPYSKATGPDCIKTYIFDPKQVDAKVKNWEKDKYVILKNNVDAVIYEMHVRDYTIDQTSGIKQKNKGKYLGLTSKNSKSPEGSKTGLSNIADLGVTHVHLLPSYDYGTGDEAEVNSLYTWYNWGYDPVLYFNPEGSYSTYPDGTTRLIEYKKMVKTFHKKNIGVIQDIVFNHTFQTGDAKMSIFDKIVPKYFYRVKDNGEYANGSYCGNEVASERPMVRKFIVDNLEYWAKEFHIDGYRFDLMGLIDKKTMIEAFAAVKKINPNTIFYGEGWNMGNMLSEDEKMIQKNVADTGIAAFNDGIRDNLKGDVFNDTAMGFVQNHEPMTGLKRLKDQLKGQETGRNKEPIPVATPNETVNYVCAHDNLVIWDKLKISCPDADFDKIKKMDMLSFAIVITSQGIPFFGEGDEFGRTKKGDENSYNNNDPHVNPLNWSLKNKNSNMYEFYKNMIELRKEHPAFRMTSKGMVDNHFKYINNTPDNVIAYTLDNNANGDSWKTILVAFNSGDKDYKLDVKGVWNIVVKGNEASDKVISKSEGDVTIPAIGTIIAYK